MNFDNLYLTLLRVFWTEFSLQLESRTSLFSAVKIKLNQRPEKKIDLKIMSSVE